MGAGNAADHTIIHRAAKNCPSPNPASPQVEKLGCFRAKPSADTDITLSETRAGLSILNDDYYDESNDNSPSLRVTLLLFPSLPCPTAGSGIPKGTLNATASRGASLSPDFTIQQS